MLRTPANVRPRWRGVRLCGRLHERAWDSGTGLASRCSARCTPPLAPRHALSTAAPTPATRRDSWRSTASARILRWPDARHVSSNTLRQELQADANTRATGQGLPSSMQRSIDAVQPGLSGVDRSVRLGGQRNMQASDTITVDVPGRAAPLSMAAALARDSCSCPLCVDASSKQKLFQTSDIPADVRASWTVGADGAQLEIEWTNDIPGYPEDHTTRFSLGPASVPCTDSVYHPLEPAQRLIWDGQTIAEQNKWTDYSQYMTNDDVLHSTLEHLGRYGLVFLTGVPDDQKAVEHIVSRIGILKDTFYGRTWDVKSVPGAKNIAYTHQYLGLHMDLMYVTNPPHLQLLHSLRARSPGGESLFSDSLHAAHTLWHTDRDAFDVLSSVPVPFYYKNDSQSYAKWRPTIELAPQGLSPNPANSVAGGAADQLPRIKCINYSPPWQAPFASASLSDLSTASPSSPAPVTPPSFRALHAAMRKFAQLVESPASLFELRLEEGQCVIFDNRRVLHARRAFDATKGERWLKGAYVDDDVFFSRWRVLAENAAGRAGEREKVQGVLYG